MKNDAEKYIFLRIYKNIQYIQEKTSIWLY